MCVNALALPTLKTLGTVFSIASGAVGAVSTVQNSRAQAAAAEATAVSQENAARLAIEQGNQESDRARQKAAAMMAGQRVGMAANGVDVGSTAALDVLDDTRALSEQDAFAIRENARNNAASMSQRAANSRTEAANARSSGMWRAVGTVLTTAARVGPKHAHWSEY